MDVTAKYELIGLMAYPIRHSLSPEMQNKALEKAGLPFTYMAFEVDNGNDSNLLIVFYVQIMPDDFVMQLHRF